MDKDHVFLELRNNCCQHNQTIAIPLDVWEVIRHVKVAPLEMADMSDQGIRIKCENEVDERIQDMQNANSDSAKALLSIFGSAVYGDGQDPRETQIQAGTEYYRKIRNDMICLKNKMAVHKVCSKSDSDE